MSDEIPDVGPGPSTGRERRVAVRHFVQRPVFLQRGQGRSDQFWRFGKMLDLSVGGVRLLINRGFPVETYLLIEIANADASYSRSVASKIVHSTEVASGWILGCTFEEPLSEEELQKLL